MEDTQLEIRAIIDTKLIREDILNFKRNYVCSFVFH